MARVGQEMVNSVTRERFVWRHTASSTNGAFVEFDLHLGEGAVVAGRHAHPNQREDFRVESGAILLRRDDQEETLAPGDARSVEPGVPHTWANIASGDSHVVVRLTPALRSEQFFETFCALAQAGSLNKKGLPRNPLQFAVWMHEYRDEVASPSPLLRRALAPVLAVLAAVGRLGGLKADYPA